MDQYVELNGDYSESPPQPSSVIQEPPPKTTPQQNGSNENHTHKTPPTAPPLAGEDRAPSPASGGGAGATPAREGGAKGEKVPSEEVGKEEESKQSYSDTAESDSQKSGPPGGSMESGHMDNKVKIVKEESAMDVDVEGDGVMCDGDKPEPMDTSDQQATGGGMGSAEHKTNGWSTWLLWKLKCTVAPYKTAM